VRSTPQAAACFAALRPDGDRTAARGRGRGSKGVPADFGGLRRVEQRAGIQSRSKITVVIAFALICTRSAVIFV
jgi:hypothetical protein